MSTIDNINIKTLSKGDKGAKTTTVKEDIPSMDCLAPAERRCADGSCIYKNDLCEEEQILNQNTILIMIVIGMAVVIFLIILYCFQQKTRRSGTNRNSLRAFEAGLDDGDNASLYNPPPTYDEVITSGLYPATPQTRRNIRMSSSEEPITPPPNYEAALTILAQSHESVLVNKNSKNSVFRRSVSVDSMGRQTSGNNTTETRTPSSATPRLPSIGQ
ncbi:hypothetical protein LOTGIDRAFT_234148 [Lottia gigantea]|uniref:Uncharacterized protein n=1 Tax=Lottia gigantea TaxID=225164 RepID=V4BLT7_LOTGI|nr:hypothetical protein LOTGIDRAFT_234148 [Lottia gigantea]ESO89759.1 hypothetical protein LOTGIDRAFT_234148 [Lottia gigantea]